MSLAPEVGIRAQAPATDPRPFHLHCLTCPSRWPPSTVPLGGTPGLEGLRSHPAPRASRTGSRYWEVHPSVTRSKTDCVSVMHWTPTTQARRRPGHCPQQFPQGSGQSWGRQTHRHIHTDSMIPADRGPRHTPGPNRLSSGERGGERQEGNTQRPLLGAAVLLGYAWRKANDPHPQRPHRLLPPPQMGAGRDPSLALGGRGKVTPLPGASVSSSMKWEGRWLVVRPLSPTRNTF